jgi:hypothetical protein
MKSGEKMTGCASHVVKEAVLKEAGQPKTSDAKGRKIDSQWAGVYA